ncbi:MAG TPA: NUDIX hydrolase [Jatrophihabitans sp.]
MRQTDGVLASDRDAGFTGGGELKLIPAAGGIVFDENGRLLLIKRGQPPSLGNWSVPGGKCERGETGEQACIRELAEETGLQVRVVRMAGRVLRSAPSGGCYDITDFVCEIVGGSVRAGDDAAGVGWFTRQELTELPLVEGLYDSLAEWDLLPR